MNVVKIKLGDKEYPCRVTMGAMVRFKNETGKDVSRLEKGDISELMQFVYCCVKSACNADKVAFTYDFETFSDLLEPDTVNSFYASMDSEKKRLRNRRRRSKRRGFARRCDGVYRDE